MGQVIGVLTQPPNWLIWLFTHHPTPFELDLTAFFVNLTANCGKVMHVQAVASLGRTVMSFAANGHFRWMFHLLSMLGEFAARASRMVRFAGKGCKTLEREPSCHGNPATNTSWLSSSSLLLLIIIIIIWKRLLLLGSHLLQILRRSRQAWQMEETL